MKDFNEEAVLVTATAIGLGMNDDFSNILKSVVSSFLRKAYQRGKDDKDADIEVFKKEIEVLVKSRIDVLKGTRSPRIFWFNGDHTLTDEEYRSGKWSRADRDYIKLVEESE